MAEELKRRIGLPLLTAYGVGVMVGAGIYVLIGAVAAEAGVWAPLSFFVAGCIAAPTALSYAEFSSRFPDSAGEARYVAHGYGSEALGALVGLAIVVAGTVSAAAVLRGGVGYLAAIVPVSPSILIVLLGGVLVAVAVLGALESLSVAAVFTAIELIGLALVVWAGFSVPALPVLDAAPPPVWGGVMAGAVLAFFAFIGFEDIVNMAEEVKNPTRTLPIAIVSALLVTSVIYAVVAFAAIRGVAVDALSQSEQPLALVWQTARGTEGAFLSVIAVFAALNGVLAQNVMAARVLFGLGRRTPLLAGFHHAHHRFGTPVRATLLVGACVIVGALLLPVATLAEVTSTVLLGVFVLVNGALIFAKRRGFEKQGFSVPMGVPVLGLVLSAAALVVGFVAG
ncbi:amino acid permease [Marivita sp. S6314]|uniref:APC family permease n=1 Tax=Marivita sp. S6314 TaxID=2926406 RepID=UPI001FF6E533|nr:amino acid permease [Marivita sp. S6314]MCK0149377.1 amino acid permease [Marivita sp. S6314]